VKENLLDIITITYNNQNELNATLNSIYHSSGFLNNNINHKVIYAGVKPNIDTSVYTRTELIVQDGKGIYNALNQAHKVCNSKYILFIHSGDEIHPTIEFNKIMRLLFDYNYDLVAGDIELQKVNGEFIAFEKYNKYYGLRHGGVFFNINIYKKFFYDEDFISAGDFEYWNRLDSLGLYKPYPLNMTVSIFKKGGLSSNKDNFINRRRERYRIIKKYKGMSVSRKFIYNAKTYFGYIYLFFKYFKK